VQTGNVFVICSVHHATLAKVQRRINPDDADPSVPVRIVTGDVLDLPNLRKMIREADVLYNMAVPSRWAPP